MRNVITQESHALAIAYMVELAKQQGLDGVDFFTRELSTMSWRTMDRHGREFTLQGDTDAFFDGRRASEQQALWVCDTSDYATTLKVFQQHLAERKQAADYEKAKLTAINSVSYKEFGGQSFEYLQMLMEKGPIRAWKLGQGPCGRHVVALKVITSRDDRVVIGQWCQDNPSVPDVFTYMTRNIESLQVYQVPKEKAKL